jgi:hypothetical protein
MKAPYHLQRLPLVRPGPDHGHAVAPGLADEAEVLSAESIRIAPRAAGCVRCASVRRAHRSIG